MITLNKIPLILLLIIIIFFINSNAYLSPSDDVIFQTTILSSTPFVGLSDESISQGRFNPVGGFLFNVALLNPSVEFLFIISTFEILITIIIFYSTINQFIKNDLISLTLLCLLILTPPFTMSWMRLSLGEREALLFISLFIYFIINQKISSYLRIPVLLLCANLAIYSKEPYGICFLMFSFVNILGWISQKRIVDFTINLLIIISSLIFYIIYYIITKNNQGIPYNENFNSYLIINNIINYFTFDYFIFLVCIPVFIFSSYAIIRNKRFIYYPYDGLFTAGITYGLIFLYLNIFQPYYLATAYFFVLPSLIFYYKNNLLKFYVLKKILFIYFFIYLFLLLPAGIHYLTRQYYLPLNSDTTYKFLSKTIKDDNLLGNKPTLFIDGRHPNYGIGEYHLFEVFLFSNGVSDKNYDLASSLDPLIDSKKEIINWDINNFKIYDQKNKQSIEVGDYLIITPDDERFIDESYLNSLGSNYIKIFETKSPFFIPMYNFKTLIKYICINYCSEKFILKFINSKNIRNSPDFIIFKKFK